MAKEIRKKYKEQKEQFFNWFMNFRDTKDEQTKENIEQGIYKRLFWLLDHFGWREIQELTDMFKEIETLDELVDFKESLI